MISVGEVVFPLVIQIMLIVAIIYNKKTKVIKDVPILGMVAIGLYLLFNCIAVADSLFFIGSTTGLYNLPVKSGRMSNVRIVEKWGGDSLFDIYATEFKIDNSYDELLKEDTYCRVTYVPVSHRVLKIERDEK